MIHLWYINSSSMYCIVCSPPLVNSCSLPVYLDFILFYITSPLFPLLIIILLYGMFHTVIWLQEIFTSNLCAGTSMCSQININLICFFWCSFATGSFVWLPARVMNVLRGICDRKTWNGENPVYELNYFYKSRNDCWSFWWQNTMVKPEEHQ